MGARWTAELWCDPACPASSGSGPRHWDGIVLLTQVPQLRELKR